MSAASTGVVALTKASVANYAEYEQLVGGAKLMFGDAYDFIADKAANAFSEVQMSQNDYLQQVNGFATGLKTALKGNEKAAAELADKIITAEADVVAATGNSQEAVQNAFNGIMKSNYTMLDNLQIGITPTKEGFQEVIDKVNEWNAANGRATKYQIDNLADAQSALVDYIKMVGMSGYAHDEASETIQGSLAMTKSAWQNLLTGLSDDSADFSALTDNLVTSVSKLAKNIIPRVQTALGGVVNMISGLAPIIAKKLPEVISSLLPSIIEGATNIVSSFVAVIPDLFTSVVTAISKQAPLLMNAAVGMLDTIVNGLIGQLPLILTVALEIIIALANGISENLPVLIPTVISVILQIASTLTSPDMLGNLIDAALALIMALANGLITSLPELLKAAPVIITNLITAILENIPKLIEVSIELIAVLVEGLLSPNNIGLILKAAVEIVLALVEGITSMILKIGEVAVKLIGKLISGFQEKFGDINESGKNIVEQVKAGFDEKVEEAKKWGKDLIDNFVAGIKEKWESLKTAASDTAQIVKDFLGFSEPDKGPLSDFHTYAPDMMDLFDEGIEKNSKKVLEKVEKLAQKIKDKLGEIQSYFDTTIDIAEMEYQLWEMTEGIDATETEKAAKKLEMLNQQLADQKEVVEASNIAYQEMVKLYGEGSAEANAYKKTLLEEQIEYQKLSNDLNETNESYKELTKSQRTWATVAVDAVRTVSTAILESTQSSDNAVQKQQEKAVSELNGNIGELVSLFKSGKAKTSVSNAREMRGVSYG